MRHEAKDISFCGGSDNNDGVNRGELRSNERCLCGRGFCLESIFYEKQNLAKKPE
jgi:hypothetical protein